MPTYGYRCTVCNHEFEIMQRMSDAPLTTCPECQGRLQKLLYPVGVQFKGSGFYTTDYKGGKNGSSGSSKESSKESSNGSKSESSSTSESGKKSEAPAASSSSSSGSSSGGDSAKKSD